MEEYLKRQIMDTSRHQIIYGYNTKERHQFLQELEESYPVKTSSNIPIAIYMEDYILSKPNKKQSDYETISAAGEFLLTGVREEFEKNVFPPIKDSTVLALAELGNDAGVIGAASLVLIGKS